MTNIMDLFPSKKSNSFWRLVDLPLTDIITGVNKGHSICMSYTHPETSIQNIWFPDTCTLEDVWVICQMHLAFKLCRIDLTKEFFFVPDDNIGFTASALNTKNLHNMYRYMDKLYSSDWALNGFGLDTECVSNKLNSLVINGLAMPDVLFDDTSKDVAFDCVYQFVEKTSWIDLMAMQNMLNDWMIYYDKGYGYYISNIVTCNNKISCIKIKKDMVDSNEQSDKESNTK